MAATQSAPPPSDDDNPQNSAPAPVPARATIEDHGDAKAEVDKQTSPPSVFVNSEPMREDQVQNAVKFLQHPRVRGSPVVYRRSFLERKGLTKEEIDEAFRRVPDPPSNSHTATVSQDGQVNTVQPQPSTQSLQPVAAVTPPAGGESRVGTVARSRFHWSHAILAIGVLAVSGAGTVVVIKNSIIPRLKSWVRKVVLEDDDVEKKINSKPSAAEEAAAAAKAAAAAASDVAKASQEMLFSKNEEKKKFEDCFDLLVAQLGQMKLMLKAIEKLEATTYGRTTTVEQEDYRITPMSSKQPYSNGKVDPSLQSATPAKPVEPSVAPHPKSYMEIMAMVQRGEKPSNIRDIDDLPPNPNQQPSNPRLAPRAKPWEVGTQNNPGFFPQSQEDAGLNSLVQNNGVTYENDNASVPWWQKRNVNITEVENNELKVGSSNGLYAEKPVQRAWVPPQPPPVALPEAAEAIRRPKPTFQKEQFTDEPLATQPNVTDELQKATKISESGGAFDYENLGVSSSEIQVEDSGSGGQ
ncbi:peroxisomal membrane protein PEX14 isoform X1 [Benincasa hispida]|uniref:peroxisomal membrane protein PEX14 isoform X1 n=1 Tax=Benincasa hispida TaxID=102211 RepID=UPI0019002E71|nr:peroxisomal membrane protein PEX14 isoform X1 [Benincasa hispida]